MTRQEETRQLLARLSELAQDETLSEEDAAEMVAGLLGALERMRQNPAWQRVMATAGTRPSRWPRWITARHSPPPDPGAPKPGTQLSMRPLARTGETKRLEPPGPHYCRGAPARSVAYADGEYVVRHICAI